MIAFQVCPCSTTLICDQSTITFLLSTFKFIHISSVISKEKNILYLELEAAARRVRIQGEVVTVISRNIYGKMLG
jgi:hypothetical protein